MAAAKALYASARRSVSGKATDSLTLGFACARAACDFRASIEAAPTAKVRRLMRSMDLPIRDDGAVPSGRVEFHSRLIMREAKCTSWYVLSNQRRLEVA